MRRSEMYKKLIKNVFNGMKEEANRLSVNFVTTVFWTNHSVRTVLDSAGLGLPKLAWIYRHTKKQMKQS